MIECVLACGVNGIGLAVMHLVGCHETDTGVVMVLIVPIKKAAAETSGILDAAEPQGESLLILEGFEVAFGERIVI